MASHTGKRRSLFGIDNAVYSESDAETISYDYDESSGRRSTIDGDPERLRGRHFLEYVPPTKKKTDPTRMCVVCCSRRRSDGKKVRKETRFHCPDCDVGLCAIPCFKDYHTKADY